MKTYTINQLMGEAYLEALHNVMWTCKNILGIEVFQVRDGAQFDMLAEKLGIRFDENGNIVR